MSKPIYEGGGIEVDSEDYVHFRDEEDMDAEPETEEEEYEPIPGLDDVVAPAGALRFELDYPFEKPFVGEVRSAAGITLRNVVDAIRGGYRVMYEGTTAEAIPNLVNMRVEGDYGTAFHVMSDLVIEAIDLDEATGTLEIAIGS